MAQVTSPLLLDGTGQTMVSKLESIRSAVAAKVTPATTATAGIVKPDGTTIAVSADGTISATTQVALATTAAPGIVQPDGTSITVTNSGVISAQGETLSFATVTLASGSWSNNVYSCESQYPSSSYDILDVTPTELATDAERKAWISADCGGYRSTNTIYAHGTVPTINIPVALLLRSK